MAEAALKSRQVLPMMDLGRYWCLPGMVCPPLIILIRNSLRGAGAVFVEQYCNRRALHPSVVSVFGILKVSHGATWLRLTFAQKEMVESVPMTLPLCFLNTVISPP